MATRGEQLAAKFEQANNDVIAAVEAMSDDQWQKTCAEEQWPVAVTAHHIASGTPLIMGLVQGLSSGAQLPQLTMAQIDQGNADHAKQFANCTRDEVVSLLRSDGATAVGVLRGLSDDQLDKKAAVISGLPEMTTEQVAEAVLIGSATGHLASIKKAI